MRAIKHIAILLALPACVSIASAQNPKKAPQDLTDNKILNTVDAVPEVKAFMKTHKHAATLLYAHPTKNFKYYWVKLGENLPDHFATTENFYVDPSTYQIYYLDTMSNDTNNVITLKQWRKWRSSLLFNQSHHFKNGRLIKD